MSRDKRFESLTDIEIALLRKRGRVEGEQELVRTFDVDVKLRFTASSSDDLLAKIDVREFQQLASALLASLDEKGRIFHFEAILENVAEIVTSVVEGVVSNRTYAEHGYNELVRDVCGKEILRSALIADSANRHILVEMDESYFKIDVVETNEVVE